jgi:hypothetical protein
VGVINIVVHTDRESKHARKIFIHYNPVLLSFMTSKFITAAADSGISKFQNVISALVLTSHLIVYLIADYGLLF